MLFQIKIYEAALLIIFAAITIGVPLFAAYYFIIKEDPKSKMEKLPGGIFVFSELDKNEKYHWAKCYIPKETKEEAKIFRSETNNNRKIIATFTEKEFENYLKAINKTAAQ